MDMSAVAAECAFESGNAHYAKKDYDRAIADYDEAIQLKPQYAAALVWRGNAYVAKDQYDRAIADYDQAIQLNPKDASDYHVERNKNLDAAIVAVMRANNVRDKPDAQPNATKLVTPEDVENYGPELIDLVKRAAKEAVSPELNALRQEFLSQFDAMRATAAPTMPAAPSELTWAQIVLNLTKAANSAESKPVPYLPSRLKIGSQSGPGDWLASSLARAKNSAEGGSASALRAKYRTAAVKSRPRHLARPFA